MHKSGFVNIIGNPNVGKSTLMNALVGERLSIITSKAQTTRHRILGIVNGEDFQIVYSDTPGILKPNYKLHESMMKVVQGALKDADVILYVTDATEGTDHRSEYVDKIRLSGIKTILVINKIDLTTPEELEKLVDEWEKILPDAVIVPVSAAHAFNIGGLFDRILDMLPEGEPYYPKDALTVFLRLRLFVKRYCLITIRRYLIALRLQSKSIKRNLQSIVFRRLSMFRERVRRGLLLAIEAPNSKRWALRHVPIWNSSWGKRSFYNFLSR